MKIDSQTKKNKNPYIKPVVKTEKLVGRLSRDFNAEIDMFNYLAAQCDWESY